MKRKLCLLRMTAAAAIDVLEAHGRRKNISIFFAASNVILSAPKQIGKRVPSVIGSMGTACSLSKSFGDKTTQKQNKEKHQGSTADMKTLSYYECAIQARVNL